MGLTWRKAVERRNDDKKAEPLEHGERRVIHPGI